MIYMINPGTKASDLLENCAKMLKQLSEGFSTYDYIHLRQEVFKFFAERHTKVSLFIQDKIQAADGSIYLDFCGEGPEA